jgi:predicted kinase
LTRFDVDHVAQRIAGFHAAAPIVAAPAAFRNQLRATLGALASADRTTYVLKLDDALVRAQQRCRSELRERVNRGLVREGHGDLRAEHVVMTEPVQIFDCVEFDPGLREIDVGADLAFLVMDLERLGRPGEARQLVEAYASAGGDPGSPQLRALFAAYRASVRALAAALLVRESRGDARHRAAFERDALIRLAWSFAWRSHRPRVVAVCGPAAVGKTTLAREIAELARLPYLSSDRVRKGLAGVRASERAPADAYDAQMNARVYEQLGRDAARSRHGAVVDATFRFRDDRDSFRHAAGSISPLFVQCAAPPGLAVARARRRVTSRTVESDAGEEQARIQAAEFEPLVEIPRRQWLPVDTTGPVELAAAAVEANLERGDRVRSYAFR